MKNVVMLSDIVLSVDKLSVVLPFSMLVAYLMCHYAECIMKSDVMLSVIMLRAL